MDRSNHYEAAFEAYLQWRGWCYVAVDETRRSQFGGVSLKSLDFIVHGEAGARLLIDVKGRRYPSGSAEKRRRVFETWSTEEDIEGLERWQDLFGPSYRGLLVFAYEVLAEAALPQEVEDLWNWRGRRYLFRGIGVDEYRHHMRVRSPRWRTVSIPRLAFRACAVPFHHFLQHSPALPDACPF